jgi:Pyruvate/2-oxoacid:ferredoxin oxidoreductase delta subunit
MAIKEVTIYFTSGTGNSYRAAEWCAAVGQKRGARTRVLRIEGARPGEELKPGRDALVGLAMPTHAFIAPWHMLKFAARLPKGQGTPAFSLATRASLKLGGWITPGINGSGNFIIALILGLKGYRVRGIMSLDMPSNWTSLHPGLRPQNVEAILTRARPRATAFMEKTLAGAPVWFTLNNLWELLWGMILLPVSLGFLFLGRMALGKLFFANNDCNSCGVCADNCPVGAIRMWGRKRPLPYWTWHCESCMRCMNYCPKRAIEASHSWLVVVYLLAVYLPVWIMGYLGLPLLDFGEWNSTVNITLFTVLMILLSFVFYPLLRVRVFNYFFTYTTLTHLYRRYHEPGAKLKDLAGPRG